MCFASTKCATIEPGKSWELSPFCGRSTCVVAEGEQAGRLLELVSSHLGPSNNFKFKFISLEFFNFYCEMQITIFIFKNIPNFFLGKKVKNKK